VGAYIIHLGYSGCLHHTSGLKWVVTYILLQWVLTSYIWLQWVLTSYIWATVGAYIIHLGYSGCLHPTPGLQWVLKPNMWATVIAYITHLDCSNAVIFHLTLGHLWCVHVTSGLHRRELHISQCYSMFFYIYFILVGTAKL
jgi:hypothetical protein